MAKKPKIISEREAEQMYEVVKGFHASDGSRFDVSGRGFNLVKPADFTKADWTALVEMEAVAQFVADGENETNG